MTQWKSSLCRHYVISILFTTCIQFKLVEVEEVCLLTKKGYLTIALTHARDGRVLLRRHEGIRDWFSMIKVTARLQ